MKLFLGYIFAFIFVFNTSVSEYIQNDLGNQFDELFQDELSLNDFNSSISPYQNQVHHLLGVDFQEKNEKFKKFLIPSSNVLVGFNSYPPEISKFNSFYFLKLITPSISRYILLEMFLI